ncbi:ribosomal protein S5 domain 2-like protein [Dichomitus squalens LYAD-421 SS1]|nr:ribosomal protein S5 domain 2-like protein [Dichomitus squalens LYAD-421 SS1]EJF60044.1 ribosomal protein S5 domain 2-like protein [Dichomitus squalens LYAD-421 SS1]
MRWHSTATWHGPLAISDQLVQQKSTFQAYATRYQAEADAPATFSRLMKITAMPQLLAHIQEVDPRTRRASHAMYAWRLRSSSLISSSLVLGSSNGGEAGAGERLERLLELSNCEDVVLVVFRWYGGVKLGSDRWRCISTVAKEALKRGGFLSGSREASDRARSRNGSRKRGK